MIRISYMVHGTTIENEQDIAAGWAPGTLSSRGIEGCRELAPRLRDLGLDVIYVSDTVRAMESARLFFGEDQELHIDPRLREVNYGQRTGGPRREIEAMMDQGPEIRFPGGESLHDVEARMRSLVATLERRWPGRHVGIVAHRATQNALEVILQGKTWAGALASDWRHTKDFRGVWTYSVPDPVPPEADAKLELPADPDGIVVRPETPADWVAIRRVNDLAFGQPQEGRLVDEIRGRPGFVTDLSLVAVAGECVVGHILFSPIIVVSRGGPVAAWGLAPMAVHPAAQRRGIGSALVRHGLQECRERNQNRIVVLGHADFYPRFGFVPASRYGVTCPFPAKDENFMAQELVPRAWQGAAGRVIYPEPFDM